MYSRVDPSMDLDYNSHKVNERKRINGILNFGEVTVFGILVDGNGTRREKLVFCCPEN